MSNNEVRLAEAEQIILDLILTDVPDDAAEGVEDLKRRAREFLNGRLESIKAQREAQEASRDAQEGL